MKRRYKVACIAVITLLLLSLLLSRSQIGCSVDINIHSGDAAFMGIIQGEYICDAYSWSKTIPFEITPDKALNIEEQVCWRNPIKVIFLWAISLISFHSHGIEADTVINLKVPKERLFDAKSSGAYLISRRESYVPGSNVRSIKTYFKHKDYAFFKITKYFRLKSEEENPSEEKLYDIEITIPSSRKYRQRIDLYFH